MKTACISFRGADAPAPQRVLFFFFFPLKDSERCLAVICAIARDRFFSSRFSFLFPFPLSIILSFASPSFSDLPFVAREGRDGGCGVGRKPGCEDE